MADPVLLIAETRHGRPVHALQYAPLTADQRRRQTAKQLTARALPGDRQDMTLDQAIAWAWDAAP